MINRLVEKFDSHVAVCSALGLAAVAAAPCDEAEAVDIIYYQPNGGAGWTIPATIDGLYINVETQATSTSSFAGWDINPYSSSGLGWYNDGQTDGRGSMYFPGVTVGPPSNLPLGMVVGSTQTFTGFAQPVAFGAGTGQWVLNASNYLGFRFNGGDGFQRYGWLRIDIGASATTRTIMEVGYNNTPGESILVGQTVVPEPSTVVMGLLAGGAAGVIAWRRKKASA